MLGGIAITEFGIATSPNIIPNTVVITILISMPPLTFFISNPAIIISPNTERTTGRLNFPSATRVASFPTIIPIFFNPINAINRPIPAVEAVVIGAGIAFASFSLNPKAARIKKNMPDKNTTPRASCQDTPFPITRVKVKNAFSPIPGAIAIGTFPINAAKNVPIAVARQVTVISAPLSIPDMERIAGLTNIIYAIARNVVTPPITSVFTLLFLSLILNTFSKNNSLDKIFPP